MKKFLFALSAIITFALASCNSEKSSASNEGGSSSFTGDPKDYNGDYMVTSWEVNNPNFDQLSADEKKEYEDELALIRWQLEGSSMNAKFDDEEGFVSLGYFGGRIEIKQTSPGVYEIAERGIRIKFKLGKKDGKKAITIVAYVNGGTMTIVATKVSDDSYGIEKMGIEAEEIALIDVYGEDDMDFEDPEAEAEVLMQEFLNTHAVPAIDFTENENVEIKITDEIIEDERALVDLGVDDIINAQEYKEHMEAVVVEERTPQPVETNKVFEAVEDMPTFPGGDQALYQWIGDHLRYPKSAADQGISGRVTVRFVIKKDGSIGEVRVLRGKHPDLDKEAVRVVNALPNFQPGRQNGQAVDVWYTLPVNFRLEH